MPEACLMLYFRLFQQSKGQRDVLKHQELKKKKVRFERKISFKRCLMLTTAQSYVHTGENLQDKSPEELKQHQERTFRLCYASRSVLFPREYRISSYVIRGEYCYSMSQWNKLNALHFSALITKFMLMRWLQSGLSENSSGVKHLPRWKKMQRATTHRSSCCNFTGSFISQQWFVFLIKINHLSISNLSQSFQGGISIPGTAAIPERPAASSANTFIRSKDIR